jgi:hypothetical protein
MKAMFAEISALRSVVFKSSFFHPRLKWAPRSVFMIVVRLNGWHLSGLEMEAN